MRHLDHLDLARRELAQHGIVPHVSTTNGSHLRMEWTFNGQRLFVFASESPSDWRVARKVRADVRRLLRKAGLAA
jgi:hypothetical protein